MERRSKESHKICIEEMAMFQKLPKNKISSYFSPKFKAFDALQRHENHSQVEGEGDYDSDDEALIDDD